MAITAAEEEEDLAKGEDQWYATIMERRATMLETALNLRRLAHIADKNIMWSNFHNLLLDGKPRQLEQLTQHQILHPMLPTRIIMPIYK